MTYRLCTLFLLLLAITSSSLPAYAQESRRRLPQVESIEVNLAGIDNTAIADNIRANVELFAVDPEDPPRAFRLRYLYRQAEQQIRNAVQPFGYYHSTVKTDIERQENDWQITLNVSLGEPTRIKDLTVDIKGAAANDSAFQRLVENLPIQLDKPFVHDDYERSKRLLQNLGAERGYFDAKLTKQQADVELSDKSVVIELAFESGKRYQFGDVHFSESPIQESLLKRFVPFESGEDFTAGELLDLQIALTDSDYFSSVEVDPKIDDAEDQTLPVNVMLEPNRRNRYRFGLGYGTDTGARVTLGQERRWVNERGHKFNGIVRFSEVQTTGAINYIIPGDNPATDRYTIGGDITDKDNDEQRAQIYRVGVSDFRKLDNWQRTFALNWVQEDFKFGETLQGSSQYLIPSARFSLIETEDRTDVNHGYRIGLEFRMGSDSFLSDTDFFTAITETKYVYRFHPQWRILARAELGATYVTDFDQLSPSLRFFAGGDNSVRGYAYEQLGPEDPDGVVTGGRYLAVASAEIDYEFRNNWRVAAFTDVGNAFVNFDDKLKQSVGIGVRWVSPIGAIRLDVAQAIDEPGNPWRIHFTIGPDL